MKYICELCGTVYDEAIGNTRAGIVPGTLFADLPEDYECPGCGYLKEALNPMKKAVKNIPGTQAEGKDAC